MDEIRLSNRIIDLGSIGLIIVPLGDSSLNVIKLKVYERENFFSNPIPDINQTQIAEFSTSANSFSKAVVEIQELYDGWAKIDKSETTTIIGIHNQNPNVLYIQFSHGERYFIYKRCLTLSKEMIYEELFGKKHNVSRRSLNHEDEQYLISKLRFMPKTKNAISFYSYKPQKRAKRHFSFSSSS